MKLKFLQLVFWIWFVTRGYYLWSKFWRFLLERDYREQPLTAYASMAQLEEHLGKMTWVQDPLGGMFDVISSPQKVEAILRKKLTGECEVAAAGDCDEFAQYAADRIENMVGLHRANVKAPQFMTVNWLDKDGKFHGHNICAFYDLATKRWAHIGNWNSGKAMHGDFGDMIDIAKWFAEQSEGKLIGFATCSPFLKNVTVYIG